MSFSNVLEGARQYFQGLPAPSTAGTTPSTDNLATSTSSSYGHGDVTASAAGPTSSSTVAPVSREASATARIDSRTAEDPANQNQVANSYWNPPGPVEPYAPQPTRVEVPDTRPIDGSCSCLEVPTGSLTEMQPVKKSYDHNSAHSSSTTQLHQLQPPKTCSPPPVYQQLNTVSRTPYSTSTEMVPTQSAYQAVAERAAPSPAMVAPRTQYYPRYHHPDITKSTPLPMTQSSTYQSANVVPGSGVLQQPATRSSPAEQGYALPSGNGSLSRVQDCTEVHNQVGRSYATTSVSNGGHQQVYTTRNAVPTSSTQQQSAVSPATSNVNQTHHGNAHTHIPSPHNLPPHIPSSQNSGRVNPSPIGHPTGTGTGYCPRVSPHIQTLNSGYSSSSHEASPRHAPSPHASNSSTFQPHSPTYPPPPQSTPHSYPSQSSQHYQNSSYPGSGYQQPQSSSYHSLQKNPNPGYYSQSNRPQGYTAPPTTANNSPYVGHGKSLAYNGVQDPNRRNCPEPTAPTYQSYQNPVGGQQRTSNTHNLPPIAALASYHYHRGREAVSKVPQRQTVPRPQSSTKNTAGGLQPPQPLPSRISEYSVSGSSHTVNGNIGTSPSSMYSRTGGPQYARSSTTVAPSHHGSSASSTTVASNGAPISTRSNPPTPVSSAMVHPGYPTNSGRGVNPYPSAPHGPADSYVYKDYHSSSTAYPTSTVVSQSVPPPSANSGSLQNGTSNRKRESPLDLSLRTIKTPADSTAQDDPEASSGDKMVSSTNTLSRNSGRSMLMPSGAAYPPYEELRGFGQSRSPASGVRASTPMQTVRAPKVDFLPNFSATPLRHPAQPRETGYEINGTLKRSTSQNIYAPSSRANPPMLPNMSSFKRNPTSSLPAYDKNSPYRTRYMPVDPNGNAIPQQDYVSVPNKYYPDRKVPEHPSAYARDRHQTTKRSAADTAYAVPSKQPRLDTWRLTIDQQIEQRLTTALHERQQRQEVSLPGPVPNGVSQGYDQPGHRENAYNHCDKRSYVDPKGSRNSFGSSSSSALYGSQANQGNPRMAGHMHTPHSSGHQTSYPSNRPVLGQDHGYRVPSSGQNVQAPSTMGADKRVLSLLRNSLENKQHREEQLNNSQQPILANHNQQSFQNKVSLRVLGSLN